VVHKDSNGDVMAVLGQREDFDENGKMEDIWDTLIEIPDPDTLRGMQKRCGTLHGAWLNLWENIARVLK
jgi:hypothetical protein